MTLTCIAVDDEPSSLSLITNFAKENPSLNLIFSTTNSLEAQKFIINHPVDLLITDISMPNLTGIELSQQITQESKTIFITGYTSCALEALDKKAIEILKKPFSQKDFDEAVYKALKVIVFDKQIKANNKYLVNYEALTEAEKKIIQGIGLGKSNIQIASEGFISINTLDSHKTNIKQKLGLKTSKELFLFASELLKII